MLNALVLCLANGGACGVKTNILTANHCQVVSSAEVKANAALRDKGTALYRLVSAVILVMNR